MKEIYPSLFIGAQDDFELIVRREQGWSVVHAFKEPYHRQALGYKTQGAPKTHPEYLIARRGERLILNLVDADNPAYIPAEIIDAALAFIHEQLASERRVLVHCNQGEREPPGIGLLYLLKHTDKLPRTSFSEAEEAFRALYPLYNPAGGMRGFMMQQWQAYLNEQAG